MVCARSHCTLPPRSMRALASRRSPLQPAPSGAAACCLGSPCHLGRHPAPSVRQHSQLPFDHSTPQLACWWLWVQIRPPRHLLAFQTARRPGRAMYPLASSALCTLRVGWGCQWLRRRPVDLPFRFHHRRCAHALDILRCRLYESSHQLLHPRHRLPLPPNSSLPLHGPPCSDFHLMASTSTAMSSFHRLGPSQAHRSLQSDFLPRAMCSGGLLVGWTTCPLALWARRMSHLGSQRQRSRREPPDSPSGVLGCSCWL